MKPVFAPVGAAILVMACAAPATQPAAPPEPTPTLAATASRCLDGVRRVDHWAGEYPTPVLQVDAAIAVPARLDPCEVATTTTCRLEPGIYHPWTDIGVYATLRRGQRYIAREATQLEIDETETVALAAGETLEVVSYLSEGYCTYLVRDVMVDALCPGVADETLALDDPRPPFSLQVLRGPCGAWIDVDDALMARPGVGEGQILEYGVVGPTE